MIDPGDYHGYRAGTQGWQIEDIEDSSGNVRTSSVLVTQTSGDGVYTADIPLPAASWLVDFCVLPLVAWDGISADGDLGDELDPDGFKASLDLKMVTTKICFLNGDIDGPYAAELSMGSNIGMSYSAVARTLRLTVTQIGAGTLGRTLLMATYASPMPGAATKG